jgi:hypothetical protein
MASYDNGPIGVQFNYDEPPLTHQIANELPMPGTNFGTNFDDPAGLYHPFEFEGL